MRKIMCPTDFSDAANNGISYAAKLCQATSGTLTIFNVQSLLEKTVGDAVMGREFNENSMALELEEQCAQIRKAFHISCEASVDAAVGSAIKLISNKAGEFDLLVMGTTGPHDLVQFLIGSQTYRVVKQTQTPVLLVPASAGYSTIEKVVYGYDCLNGKTPPMAQVSDFVESLKSALTILHVNKNRYTREDEVKLHQVHSALNADHKELAFQLDTVYSDEVVNTLHRYMSSGKADVLALCTEDHGFLEGLFHNSTIKAMSVIADYPVLVAHA